MERLRRASGTGAWHRARPVAAPLLIVLMALLAAAPAIFAGMLPADPQLLARWLPNHCLLGRSLASGVIPAWSPNPGGGAAFVADPRSGWLYLLPMLLYPTLGCDAGALVFVALQPLVAGLGLYWLLRSERLARVPACVGGVALAA
ncbi:MAG: hypothetical protein ACRDJ5_01320, partial [Actinomycetota bacterium]